MLIFRKFIVLILSVLLYTVIIGAATATTITLVFAKPTKVETMLVQSKIYDNFISNVLQQANASQENSSGGGISTTDAAVQTAADEAFPSTDLQKYVTTVIDANYAWLQGKTTKPVFTIDLSDAKQTFATSVGKSVTSYLAGLPVCTAAELQSINYAQADPLTVTCRPATVNPIAEGAKITAKLLSSDGFLSQTTFTADDLGQKGNTPYYQKLSFAPTVYHYATIAPFIALGVIVILSVLILFIAPRKRNGVRSLSIVFFISGIVLIACRFGLDYGYGQVKNRAFNNDKVGPLQQSLTDFLQRLEHAVASNYEYIGIVLVVLSIIGFVSLLLTRKQRKVTKKVPQPQQKPTDNQDAPSSQPPAQRPTTAIPPIRTAPRVPTTSPRPTPQNPKRPRLIQ